MNCHWNTTIRCHLLWFRGSRRSFRLRVDVPRNRRKSAVAIEIHWDESQRTGWDGKRNMHLNWGLALWRVYCPSDYYINMKYRNYYTMRFRPLCDQALTLLSSSSTFTGAFELCLSRCLVWALLTKPQPYIIVSKVPIQMETSIAYCMKSYN